MESLTLTSESTLEEALTKLDKGGIGMLPVVKDDKTLIGIITDGDIRRALLNKELNLEKVINYKPVTLKKGLTRKEIIAHLKTIHRRHMPIVDEDNKLIEVFYLDNAQEVAKPNHIVIMAGGLGSRLGELTKEVPKPMLKIGGTPILELIITNFIERGFANFILCVNYKSHIIQDYFGDGSSLGVNIQYTHETKRLGTAGALSLIEKKLEEPFFVTNADLITNLDLEAMLIEHQKEESEATMCIKKYDFQVPFAKVKLDNDKNITGLEEKPWYHYYVNAGIYLLSPDVLQHIPKDVFYDMPTLFNDLVDQGKKVKAFTTEDYWLDIGRKEDYSKAQDDLKL